MYVCESEFTSFHSINSFENKAVFEFRETYDWLEGKGVYPDEEVPNFNSSLNELHEQCKDLAKRVLRLWAIGLDLDDVEFFIKKHQHWVNSDKFMGLTNMRVAHYPAIPDDMELPENSVRIAEHTDKVSLSFVFQDETGGLEVLIPRSRVPFSVSNSMEYDWLLFTLRYSMVNFDDYLGEGYKWVD